mgnify:CR=1 FL=1
MNRLSTLRSLGFALLAIAFVGAFEGRARAQDTLVGGGMDLRLFRPAIDSRGFISVNGADILSHNKFSFGLVLDGGFNILPFSGYSENDNAPAAEASRRDHIVERFFTGSFHFNYGLFDRLVVGVQVPVHLIYGGAVEVPGVFNTGGTASGLSYQSIGDVTLHAKVRILHPERHAIGLAGIVHLQLPSGNDRSFAGEPGVAVWPVIAAEWRPLERLRLGLNAGYRFNSGDGATFPLRGATIPGSALGNATDATLTNPGTALTYDDLLTFGFGVSYRVTSTLDLVAETYGTQLVKDFGTRGALSMEALGGLKIFVQRNSYLLMAGGAGFPRSGFEAANWRAVLGFIFEPSINDRDGDGIKDDIDKCPDEPEDFDGFQDEDGCPDPDNDKDGIPDKSDKCPNTPEDFDGHEDQDGCPEGQEGDRDGDGIPDDVDKCPDDPEDRDGFEDQDGCPDPDNDGDGIKDKDDLCPNEAEDKDGFQDKDGCPDPDNDNDRILDPDDACPNKPETYNGFEDEDGCPDKGKVIIEGNQLLILEKIYFETDSAKIQTRSDPILNAVAATVNGNPQIKLVEIQGHADERGNDAYNLRLTRDRAASVVEALVGRGVDRSRLRSAGYGELCPVDPSHTPAAWEKNRRVEFKIIETDKGPTGVEVACPAGKKYIPR